MAKRKPVTPAVKYFLKHMERRTQQLAAEVEAEKQAQQDVPFDEVESFFRQIMTQNIFIHTVGINGRPESTILSKAIFSMNKVVRVYYSTSFDERETGFIRIQPHNDLQRIIVEKVHGYRTTPDIIYQSHDECHVVRFMTRWLMRRIDWKKTHIRNLDLYKHFLEQEKREEEERLAKLEAMRLEEQMAKAAEVLKGSAYGGGGE